VVEKQMSIHEVISASNEDRLVECFGASTSNFVQPVKQLVYKDVSIDLARQENSFTQYLRDTLQKIKSGPASHSWVEDLSA
jgi:branched-subunit amino acid aminotransferase/4-amino-4-deoxychorismate lyase